MSNRAHLFVLSSTHWHICEHPTITTHIQNTNANAMLRINCECENANARMRECDDYRTLIGRKQLLSNNPHRTAIGWTQLLSNNPQRKAIGRNQLLSNNTHRKAIGRNQLLSNNPHRKAIGRKQLLSNSPQRKLSFGNSNSLPNILQSISRCGLRFSFRPGCRNFCLYCRRPKHRFSVFGPLPPPAHQPTSTPWNEKKKAPPAGLEPTIFGLEKRCSANWAMSACLVLTPHWATRFGCSFLAFQSDKIEHCFYLLAIPNWKRDIDLGL